ncbi:substrate-binding domain-containing protein [Frankia gtarii]|uniref:substrate-binding domain-containing protein n=1 Tax=Frankia gtarii TaxID=2950102 RepID=UPI0021C01538|nr:substrate-binding domain-containing protein [Frankia gtarii]
MRTRKRIGLSLAAAAAVLVGVAACGSSGSSDTAGASGAAEPQSTASSSSEAAEYLAKVVAAPSGIGYSTPITKKAPPGLRVVVLEANVPIARRIDEERAAAAEALGWKYSKIVIGTGAEDAAKAMSQALDQKPDFIFEAGYNMSAFGDQVARAQSQGVKIIAQCITDKPSGPLIAVDCDLHSTDLMAKATAAYIAAHGNGEDVIQLLSSTAFPIDDYYGKSLANQLKPWCPKCEVKTVSFQLSDLGTKLPGMVVSALQRDPDTTYIVSSFGDALTGVEPALAAAGLTGKVKIGGYLPGVDQYQALRDKKQVFWAQDQAPIAGWREMDIAARAAVGDPISTVTNTAPVSQVLTSDNIGSASFDTSGFWLGVRDFADTYKKLWLLS